MSNKRSDFQTLSYTLTAATELKVELDDNVTMVKIRPRTGTVLLASAAGNTGGASAGGSQYCTLKQTDPWFILENLTGPRTLYFLSSGGDVIEIATLR